MASNSAKADFVPASDRSLLVSFAGGITLETHRRIAAFVRRLATDPAPGVLNIHPAYCSVLIVFDPLRTGHGELEAALSRRLVNLEDAAVEGPRTVEIPVCYGGDFGPDLEEVAALHGLSPDRVIELHSSASYLAHFIGFVPGYAYLGGLPDEIVTPRLSAPRPKAPAGSVAIAGRQAGIYPFETPGGWRLLGRTPLAMFKPDRVPMSLIALGDQVRFVPISRAQFEEAVR